MYANIPPLGILCQITHLGAEQWTGSLLWQSVLRMAVHIICITNYFTSVYPYINHHPSSHAYCHFLSPIRHLYCSDHMEIWPNTSICFLFLTYFAMWSLGSICLCCWLFLSVADNSPLHTCITSFISIHPYVHLVLPCSDLFWVVFYWALEPWLTGV